jgi:hypothetical protein
LRFHGFIRGTGLSDSTGVERQSVDPEWICLGIMPGWSLSPSHGVNAAKPETARDLWTMQGAAAKTAIR